MMDVVSFLKRMTHKDIVFGLLYLGPDEYFTDECFEGRLRKAAVKYDPLRPIIKTRKTLPLGDITSGLDNSLDLGQTIGVIRDGEYQYRKMTSSGRKWVESRLKQEYGGRTLEYLKEVAELVWSN